MVPQAGNRVLLVQCTDGTGLIHGVTGVLSRHGLNIVSNGEFVDVPTGTFFMRTEVEGGMDEAGVVSEMTGVLPPLASVSFLPRGPRRVVVLATKEYHCLGDLLLRNAHGNLGATIEAVVSNHDVLAPLTARFDVPFHFVDSAGLSRTEHESRVLAEVERYAPEYVVLAKYMRILGEAFLDRFPSRIVNIHHSFLPAFVGAHPYRQASERGVKIIGATAHFVTERLDDGPIIAQRVIPVDHTHTPADMERAGRDVEKIVLAGALRLVFEGRVFLAGNRTVIL